MTMSVKTRIEKKTKGVSEGVGLSAGRAKDFGLYCNNYPLACSRDLTMVIRNTYFQPRIINLAGSIPIILMNASKK